MRMVLPKGRLLEGVISALEQVGVRFDLVDRNYSPRCSDDAIEAKLLKVRAIPQLVALGNFDVGFCGLDLVREADYDDVVPLVDLGCNAVDIVVAVAKKDANILQCPPRRPLLIATEYEQLANRWAFDHNLAHIVIQTYGSTEGYAPADADIVFDCRETGRTLAANDLVVIETLMSSSTWCVVNRRALADEQRGVSVRALAERLRALLS